MDKIKNNLKVELVDIDTLIPYINNTKKHPKEQIEQIKASIVEFGFNDPLGVKDNVVIVGNGRLQAAKELGIKKVSIIRLDHLSEAQKKAYAIAHNKLTMNSDFDEEMLKLELEVLQEMNFDLELIGFSGDELDEIMEDFNINNNKVDYEKADEIPEVEEENIVIKKGDLTELGEHRLLCGDSTDENDVKRLMNGEIADMVFTDPPYGIGYKNNMSNKFEVIKNDDIFLDGWIPLVSKYSKGFIFVWTSYQVVEKWINILKDEFNEINNMIIWHKGGGGLGDLYKTLATDFEIGLVIHRGTEIQGKRISAFWDFLLKRKLEYIKKAKKDELVEILETILKGEVVFNIKRDNVLYYLHPTQKPVELIEKGLEKFSKKNQIVLDLFLGSGSTLIACENLKRKCYGMELDEKYCQVIIQRWCDYTGIDEIIINGKKVKWSEYKEKVKK